jgi:hypothetical protein
VYATEDALIQIDSSDRDRPIARERSSQVVKKSKVFGRRSLPEEDFGPAGSGLDGLQGGICKLQGSPKKFYDIIWID